MAASPVPVGMRSLGTTTTVPFRPSPGRPVYCRDCYRARSGSGGGGGGRMRR